MMMNKIISNLWMLSKEFYNDGYTYCQYVTELTYILFLKMFKDTEREKDIPECYRWDALRNMEESRLIRFYDELLCEIGENGNGYLKGIFQGARSSIVEVNKLKKIIEYIDELNWFSAKEELSIFYQCLLEDCANERNPRYDLHFTPKALINLMIELIEPQLGEINNDPICGTFDFMISVDSYIKDKNNGLFELNEEVVRFQKYEAFTGEEVLHEVYRLALMNAMLNDIEGKIYLCDILSDQAKSMNGFDVVLTNTGFHVKKSGNVAKKEDNSNSICNNHLNYLQRICESLKTNGKSRAAVIVPDLVLFADGEGEKIRAELMGKCNLHTILRLPYGMFPGSRGVKANVLFFTRGTTDNDNTKEVWFYDLRTNKPAISNASSLGYEYFEKFVTAYKAENRRSIKDERWNVFTREELSETWDVGLITEISESIFAATTTWEEKAGDTIDEILGYYIEKFLEEEKLSEFKFCGRIGISRNVIREIRANRMKMQRLEFGQKKIQSGSRAKNTIMRIAIYTKMPFAETKRALRTVGDDFIEGHFQDEAIIEWMSAGKSDIQSLNETIHRYGEKMGIREDQYGKFEFELVPKDTKKKVKKK